VLGVMVGGILAHNFGWQMAFIFVGAGGLALAGIFPLVVKEPPSSAPGDVGRLPLRMVIRELFRFRTVNCTFVASGLQMFIQGSIIAWAPSYLDRYYELDPAAAAVGAGVLVLIAGVGMAAGGFVADRLSRTNASHRLRVPALYALCSAVALITAFLMPPGGAQFAVIAIGLLVGAGFAGPSAAVVADLTRPALHATEFATLTLANNLLGLAPGPFVTGLLADAAGLDVAMRLVPLAGVLSAVFYFAASRSYDAEHGPVTTATVS